MGPLLLLGLVSWAAVHCSRAVDHRRQPCSDTRRPDDGSGLVTLPDFGPPPLLDVSCFWSLATPGDGRKLLVRVESLSLPSDDERNSSLVLVVDGNVVDVPRNCVLCAEGSFVAAGLVELTYRSLLTEQLTVDDLPSGGIGSFSLRYETFDPTACRRPAPPENGFASTASGLGLGREVLYGCEAPYDAIGGPDRAVCRLENGTRSPVPRWAPAELPVCQMTNCSSTVYRAVGRGALASPGYPAYSLPPALDCRWVLRAEDGGDKIRLLVTFLRLSSEDADSFGTLSVSDSAGRSLGSYSSTSGEPIKLLADSSHVVISLVTNNTEVINGGFYIEYRLEAEEPGTQCQSNATGTDEEGLCPSEPDLEIGDESGLSPGLLPAEEEVANASTTAAAVFREPKPTRKAKGKAREKFQKSAAKSKVLETLPKSTETSSDDVEDSGSGDGDFSPDGQKSDGKIPLAVNSAQDKSSKSKIKGNSTSVKQRPTLELVQGTLGSGGLPSGPDGVQEQVEEEDKLLDVLEEEEEARDQEVLGLKSYVIIGVTSSLLLLLAVLVLALVLYRKRFPVRMGFGRRFSTFENPIYASKDAQHTRELKRLTV